MQNDMRQHHVLYVMYYVVGFRRGNATDYPSLRANNEICFNCAMITRLGRICATVLKQCCGQTTENYTPRILYQNLERGIREKY